MDSKPPSQTAPVPPHSRAAHLSPQIPRSISPISCRRGPGHRRQRQPGLQPGVVALAGADRPGRGDGDSGTWGPSEGKPNKNSKRAVGELAVAQKSGTQNGLATLVRGNMGTKTCGLPLRSFNFEPHSVVTMATYYGNWDPLGICREQTV